MDRDALLRDLIVEDALDIVNSDGKEIDAILVTGDIAYKADPEEFEVAKEWLQKTAATLGADERAIYVVPGNHDVNRQEAKSRAVKGVRDSILKEKGERRIEEFMSCLQETESAKLLMRPLDAYNEFAKKIACDIWAPNRPFWEDDLSINNDYKLRLNGLTSVFFSGEHDERGNLFMGSFQANISKSPNIVNLVMFHHPIDWLHDGDQIEDDLQDNVHIRLVGHKHKQRQRRDENGVTFAAAAVSPNRSENGYSPGYNILDISILNEDVPILNIDAHLRCLQEAPLKFVPIQATNNDDIFNYRYPLKKTPKQCPTPPIETTALPDHQNIKEPKLNQETTHNTRDMLIRFWRLSNGQQEKIVNNLELLTQEELELPDFECYRLAFQNACQQKKLNKLFNAIKEEIIP